MPNNGAPPDLLTTSLHRLLSAPTSPDLWTLRAGLLIEQTPLNHSIFTVIDRAYAFIIELESKSSARQYSHFASLLDIGAIGGVVVQNFIDGINDGGLFTKLLTGGLSESLMILAARQYVKAWDSEMDAVYAHAAWTLYADLWALAATRQPEQDPLARHAILARLVAPLTADDTPGAARAALVIRLYQILLLAHLTTLRTS